MATDPTVLQTYVPGQLIGWLAEQGADPVGPASKDQRLVAWFADLSDFSHLTDEITRRDRSGPELVGRLLNETFGSIVETVERHGGQVLDFAGDSVLATWLVETDEELDRALTLAARSGLEAVHLSLPEVYTELPPLDLRVGVGVGTGVLTQAGGIGDQWHFVIGGPPFDQIGVASGIARPGEVILSPEASRIAGPAIKGRSDGAGFTRITDVDETEAIDPLARPEMTPALLERIRMFLSPQVLARIDSGPSEWLSEFRQVTSVFVNLPELDLSSTTARDALQDVVTKTQKTLLKFEGTLSRVLDDDKGVSMMVAFGLPPFAHEEDPYLGIQAAEEIQGTAGMRLRYGISVPGRAFCGVYGSPDRRAYTTLGREVNLAARLMQAARFEVLCDTATKQAARRIEFHEMGVRSLRGWERPVEVFKPLWEKSAARFDQRGPGALLGRESEQTQLTGWLGALARARSSAVVLIEGEPGIGKSALAADLMRTAGSFDVLVLVGAALPVAQAPYQAWRNVLSDVLGLTDIRSLERRQEMVRQQLTKWPEFAEWEALLNSVLDLDFPETSLTRGMSGRNRRDSTVELIVALLAEAAAESPLLVILDDLHWFDSASWAVALATARKVSPLLLVLLTRPMSEPPAQLGELMDLGNSAHVVLGPLSDRDSLALARVRLGARELNDDVANLVLHTAEESRSVGISSPAGSDGSSSKTVWSDWSGRPTSWVSPNR
jgi:class 3 adenylate cyclase